MYKPRILIDVDGVCCSFIESFIRLANRVLDREYLVQDVNQFDINAALRFTKEDADLVWAETKKPGFCSELKVIEGARAAIDEIKKSSEVVIVTSPLRSTHWVEERFVWIEKHLGVDSKHVIFTKSKHYVAGDVLVDDSLENLKSWTEHHPDGLGILFTTHHNAKLRTGDLESSILRAYDWTDVLKLLKPPRYAGF